MVFRIMCIIMKKDYIPIFFKHLNIVVYFFDLGVINRRNIFLFQKFLHIYIFNHLFIHTSQEGTFMYFIDCSTAIKRFNFTIDSQKLYIFLKSPKINVPWNSAILILSSGCPITWGGFTHIYETTQLLTLPSQNLARLIMQCHRKPYVIKRWLLRSLFW